MNKQDVFIKKGIILFTIACIAVLLVITLILGVYILFLKKPHFISYVSIIPVVLIVILSLVMVLHHTYLYKGTISSIYTILVFILFSVNMAGWGYLAYVQDDGKINLFYSKYSVKNFIDHDYQNNRYIYTLRDTENMMSAYISLDYSDEKVLVEKVNELYKRFDTESNLMRNSFSYFILWAKKSPNDYPKILVLLFIILYSLVLGAAVLISGLFLWRVLQYTVLINVYGFINVLVNYSFRNIILLLFVLSSILFLLIIIFILRIQRTHERTLLR